jgi:hypothetical protein
LANLQRTVQELVDGNENLLRRLEQYHSSYVENASIRFFDDGESIFTRQEAPTHIPSSKNTADALASSKNPGSAGGAMSAREFEITLEQTRVYARVQSNDCDMSFTSSAIRTTAWSVLSGLSLNDISIISVLALPISLEEVESIGSQLTFARIISGAQEPGSPHGQDSQLPSSSVLHEVLLPPIAEETSEQRLHMYETTLTRLAVSTSPIQLQPPVHESLPAVKPRSAGKLILYTLVVLGDGGSGKTELTNQVRVTQMS